MNSSTLWRRGVLFEPFFLLIVTSGAALLRFYHLEMFPPGLHGDEGCVGLDALRVLEEGWIGPYVPSALGQPAGPSYVAALVFKLFGASHFTVRASVALLGVLSIPASYLLYRILFNQRVALLGAIFMTFSYWHLHFSRIAFPPMSLLPFEVLCLLFLFLGFKTKRTVHFVVAGAFLGLGVYTYNTYPLFLLAVLLFLAFKAIKRAYSIRSFAAQLAPFFVVAFFCALPFIVFVVHNRSDYSTRARNVSFLRDPTYLGTRNTLEKAGFIVDRAVESALVFHKSAGLDGVDGLGERPLLDPVTGGFFAVGLGICLWKWKDERYFLILIGVLTGLLGAILTTVYGGQYRRLISALPFVMLAAALALERVWGLIDARLNKKLGYLVVALAVCFVGYYNIRYYFVDFARQPSTRWVFCADLVESIEYIESLPSEGLYVYFYSDRWSYNYETRKFLLPQVPGEDRSRQFGTFSLEKADNQQNVVYLLLPPYEGLIDQIREKYPGGIYKASGEDGSVFSAYFIKGHVDL